MILKKIGFLAVCALLLTVSFTGVALAQGRDRVVKTISSRPINQPPIPSKDLTDKTKSLSSSIPLNNAVTRPTLTTDIKVVQPSAPSLVKKTGASAAIHTMAAAVRRSAYGASASGGMYSKIQSMLGIPYRYGSTGPNRYDCSGFVWTVFNHIGINFERTSARTLWNDYEPVTGDERFKFGTLVFFNRLGHVGIVADENGFYHASSSKGITYSKFEGYWQKRVVGFRRIPQSVQTQTAETKPLETNVTLQKAVQPKIIEKAQ